MSRIGLSVRVAALALLFSATYAYAGDARIPVVGGGALVLSVPDGWRSSKQPGPVATLTLTPATGNSFQVLISPLVSADGRLASATPESLRTRVESGANVARSQAVEKSLPIQELRAAGVQGSYFSATDRAPKAGEFKYITQGAMSVGGLPVAFTILSNGNPQAVVEPALRMLQRARRE